MKATLALRLAALSILGGCGSGKISQNQAETIADTYVTNSCGVLDEMVRHTEDGGDKWIIQYELQPPYPGGTPRLSVDKQSGEVEVISLTQ